MEKHTMKINRKVLSKEKAIEVKADIIVPDVKPDILSVVNTNANTYIYKEEITTGRIRLDGNIDSYVIYLAENGETRSVSVTLDFVENLEDEKISEGMRYKTSARIQNIETKVLNERKISVVANLSLNAEFYENSELELIKSLDDDCNIQKMEENYKLKNLVGANVSKTSLKESLEVSENIAEILKTEVNIDNFENKISYNKVLSKADANIKIVYQTEEMKTMVATATYPVMSFIDIENVEESHICESELKPRNMLFKVNSTESNKIMIQIDFEASVEVYKSEEITVIQDMYSLDKDLEFTKKEVDVSLDSQMNFEKVNINEKVTVEDISNIIDVSSRINIVNKTFSGVYVNYESEAVLDIMYEADSRSGINIKTVKLPFMIKLEESSSSYTSFNISKHEFNLNNEDVICNLEIECKTNKNNSKKISILEDIQEKECEHKNEYSMVVYFVKPCDTIWKIAKMFKVSMESIIKVNNLENSEKLNIGEKIYIVK